MQDNRVCSWVGSGCVSTRSPATASKAAMCSCFCCPVAQACCAASFEVGTVEQIHVCKQLSADLLYNRVISFLLQQSASRAGHA